MASRPSGLGRGLGSLIPGKKTSTTSAPILSSAPVFEEGSPLKELADDKEKIWQLPVNRIIPSPHQPRRVFDKKALEELSNSIKEHGLLQPIVVARSGSDYELIAGERRWRATQLAGLDLISAIIRDFDKQKKMEMSLIENLQREDLNALETAWAYQKLEDEFNLSHKELAQRVGKSESAIINTLRLLNLRDEVKEAIMSGQISEGHGRTLAGLPLEDQLSALQNILENKLNVREAEKSTREIVAKKKIRSSRFDPEAKALEDELAGVLGTKVEIKRHGGVGQITIKFFSNEELKQIINSIR